jgi:hypothetical protein
MTRSILAALGVSIALLVAAMTAPAASPIKGGRYYGFVYGEQTVKVTLNVSETGDRMRVGVKCGDDDFATKDSKAGVRIDGEGRFKAKIVLIPQAPDAVVTVRGRFVKHRKARGKFSASFGDRGYCTHPQGARWRARYDRFG